MKVLALVLVTVLAVACGSTPPPAPAPKEAPPPAADPLDAVIADPGATGLLITSVAPDSQAEAVG
ncbi:MAG: murein transglycosylase, partial [Planctomycetota bacterium]